MKNIFLIGWNNIAPMELYKSYIQLFYYYFAPTELHFNLENEIDRLVYELYGLTEEQIAIVGNSTK